MVAKKRAGDICQFKIVRQKRKGKKNKNKEGEEGITEACPLFDYEPSKFCLKTLVDLLVIDGQNDKI